MNIAEMNYPFANGIANLIRDKGLKQIYIAEKTGIGKQELSDMLNGQHSRRKWYQSAVYGAVSAQNGVIFMPDGLRRENKKTYEDLLIRKGREKKRKRE